MKKIYSFFLVFAILFSLFTIFSYASEEVTERYSTPSFETTKFPMDITDVDGKFDCLSVNQVDKFTGSDYMDQYKKSDYVIDKSASKPLYPYYREYGTDSVTIYSYSSDYMKFLKCFSTIYNNGFAKETVYNDDLYYICYYINWENQKADYKEMHTDVFLYASHAPLEFSNCSHESCFCINNTSPVYYSYGSFTYNDYGDEYRSGEAVATFTRYDSGNSFFHCYSQNFCNIINDTNTHPSSPNSYIYSSFPFYSFYACYSNYDVDLSMFGSSDIGKGNLGGFQTGNVDLRNTIDVELIPDFGIDMDRVIDSVSKNDEYFRFKITNNSNISVQWMAYIVQKGQEQVGDYNPDYNYCKWQYVRDEDYYDRDHTTEKKLAFKKEITFSCQKNGAFYWHILKPGESLDDVIYWENVNIEENKEYEIRFKAVPTYLKMPTNIFDSVASYDDTDLFVTWIVEQSVEDFSLKSEFIQTVFNKNFSVLTIPDYTSTIRGGNAVANGGWSDSYKQYQNFKQKTDLNTGNSVINSDYKDNVLLDDVNLDIDNISMSDMQGLISNCKSFFGLIKSVMACFPAFIWIAISIGVTAMVVLRILGR